MSYFCSCVGLWVAFHTHAINSRVEGNSTLKDLQKGKRNHNATSGSRLIHNRCRDRSPCGSMSSLETFWWILSRWSINTIPHPCTFTAYQVIAPYTGLMARPPTRIFHPHSTAVKTPSPDHKSCHSHKTRATKSETPTKSQQACLWPGTETFHLLPPLPPIRTASLRLKGFVIS